MYSASIFKNTILLAWLTSLLVSTTGVSVHRVYCFCKNESSVGFFIQPKDGCEIVTDLKTCCEVAPKSATCCSTSVEKKHNCTDKSSKFEKLDVKFVTTDFSLQLVDYQLVTSFLFSFFCETNADCPRQIARSGNVSPPPRLAGRELLIFVENFRC